MKKATKVAKAAALAAMVAMVGAMPVNAANTESAHSDITLFVPNDPLSFVNAI